MQIAAIMQNKQPHTSSSTCNVVVLHILLSSVTFVFLQRQNNA